MATVTVEQQWAFRRGARTPAGVTADDVVQEKEKIEEHLGHLATAEEAAAVVLRNERRYPAHRAFGPKTPQEAFQHAMEESVREAWRSVIKIDVQITEKRTATGEVEVVAKPVANQTEVRWFHAVPAYLGSRDRVYDSLPSIAADADKEEYLSQDLADQSRRFAFKVQTVTAELARLHKLRNHK